MFNSHQVEVASYWQIFDKNGNIVKEEFPKYQNCNIEEHLDIEIKRSDGSIRLFKQVPFKSFTKNFLDILYGALTGTMVSGISAIKTTGGSSQVTSGFGQTDATVADDSFGILIGSSNTAINLTNYQLASKIIHGSDPGQMLYGSMSFGQTNAWPGAQGAQFKIERTFTNNTSDQSDVTIQEAGLAIKSGTNSFLIARDRVTYTTAAALNEVVAFGEIVKVTYYFTVVSNSNLNINWIRILESIFSVRNVSIIPTTSTSPISINFGGTAAASNKLNLMAPAGDSSFGVVVGEATTTSSAVITSSSLGQQILHSNPGMNYGQVNSTIYTVVPPDMGEIMFSRDIINTSTGTSFTLKEFGLACAGNGSNNRILISHLELGPAVIDPTQFFRGYFKFRIRAL